MTGGVGRGPGWIERFFRPQRAGVLLVVAVLVASTGVLAAIWRSGAGDVVIGRPPAPTSTVAPDGPAPLVAGSEAEPPPAPDTPPPEPAASASLARPDGRPWGSAIDFRSAVPVPDRLVFVLVVGSDARPGEDLRRTRADSIHLLAVDPATRAGTILGFPRDSFVEIPGHGRGKINTALVLGGPPLLAETVRQVSGLPVEYYVLTGFTGLSSMVDDLGGVDVHVDRRMADRNSGAYFERGWHHFDGREALAYTRNRSDVPNGDFSRSENQGRLILAALAKARAEVGDREGLRRWLDVLSRHAELDVPASDLEPLATLGRTLDPSRLFNVVAPGRVGKAGRQSVVYLTDDAIRLFLDLRADAVPGGGSGPPPDEPDGTTTTSEPDGTDGTTSTTTPSVTTTTRPRTSTTTTSAPTTSIVVPTTVG